MEFINWSFSLQILFSLNVFIASPGVKCLVVPQCLRGAPLTGSHYHTNVNFSVNQTLIGEENAERKKCWKLKARWRQGSCEVNVKDVFISMKLSFWTFLPFGFCLIMVLNIFYFRHFLSSSLLLSIEVWIIL